MESEYSSQIAQDKSPEYAYLLMLPGLVIIILIFTIFILLLIQRRNLTQQIRALDAIVIPPPPRKKTRATQTNYERDMELADELFGVVEKKDQSSEFGMPATTILLAAGGIAAATSIDAAVGGNYLESVDVSSSADMHSNMDAIQMDFDF